MPEYLPMPWLPSISWNALPCDSPAGAGAVPPLPSSRLVDPHYQGCLIHRTLDRCRFHLHHHECQQQEVLHLKEEDPEKDDQEDPQVDRRDVRGERVLVGLDVIASWKLMLLVCADSTCGT